MLLSNQRNNSIHCSFVFAEFATHDTRDGDIDSHAVLDQHVNDSGLVLLEFVFQNTHVRLVTLACHLLLDQGFFLHAPKQTTSLDDHAPFYIKDNDFNFVDVIID